VSILGWIVLSGLLMSAIALVGSVTLLLRESTLQRVLLPLVALAAGSLIGGALFHMIPASVEEMGNRLGLYVWVVAGFVVFLVLEQFLNWQHSHETPSQRKQPLTYLILIADGLHNFIGGLSVGASFVVDVRLGVTTWLAAAAHEVPQELGDFGVLVHGGWRKASALLYNFLSGLTFLIGGVLVYAVSSEIDVSFLVPFAAGNFLYIAAADLVPEIKASDTMGRSVAHLVSFAAGLGILLLIRILLHEGAGDWLGLAGAGPVGVPML
jgi:zinc and cadmium transporter